MPCTPGIGGIHKFDHEEVRIMRIAIMKIVPVMLGMSVAVTSLAEQDMDARIARAKSDRGIICKPG